MFNYLKKHNMRNSLKMLMCLTAICVFSNNAAAKICFLPDGDCGKTKITDVNSGKNGCIYKTKGEADAGKNDECEVSYQSQVNSCWWRRCNSDNKTIFDKLADCQKKIEDATKQECQACGSCYKLVTSTTPLPDNCPSGYSTKYQSPSDCGANESFSENGTYNGLVCGACTKTETCPTGYSTQYQSQSDCPTGETFSSSGMINDKVCGKCESVTCAEMGYKTCAQCTGDQICELNGKEGSDGLCAKGCHNPTTPICDSVTNVSEKYVYIKKLIDGLAMNNEAFIRLSNVKDFDLYETMKKAKLLEGWGKSYKHAWDGKTYIDDNKGNLIAVFLRSDTVNNKNVELVHLDFYLNKSFADIDKHQDMPINDCKDIYKNLMKPLYCQVNRVGIYTTDYHTDKMTASYGDGICGGNKTCLQTIDDDTISKACNSCQSDNVRCYMPIIFGKANNT